MAHKKYRIRKFLATFGCIIAAVLSVPIVVSSCNETHAAPVDIAGASAVVVASTVPTQRTPVFPAEQPRPYTVKGPAINSDYTYYTTYLYNPSRVCTAIVTSWHESVTPSCVLVSK